MGKKKNRAGKRVVTPAVKPVVLANNQDLRPLAKKKRRAKKKQAGKMGKGAEPKDAHVRAVCSVTDPFCPAAKNSKWPDGTAGNTMTMQFRGQISLAAIGTGNYVNAIVFAPNAPFGYLTGATSAAGPPRTVTMAATYAEYMATSLLTTYGQEQRIVSMGVIARCVAPATLATGIVMFGTSGYIPVSSVLDTTLQNFDECVVKAIQPGLEFSWIAEPKGPGARTFSSLSTTTSISNDWTNFVCIFSGVPDTQPMMNFEWFVNVEFTLPKQSALAPMAKPNPPKIDAVETAVAKVHSKVGSFIEGGIKSVEDTVYNFASDALKDITSDPLGMLADFFTMF